MLACLHKFSLRAVALQGCSQIARIAQETSGTSALIYGHKIQLYHHKQCITFISLFNTLAKFINFRNWVTITLYRIGGFRKCYTFLYPPERDTRCTEHRVHDLEGAPYLHHGVSKEQATSLAHSLFCACKRQPTSYD